MYQKIREQLSTLRGIYEELLVLAKQKQAVLQAGRDLPAIERFTGQESQLVAQAAEVERERMAAAAHIAKELGVSPDSLTVSAIAAHVEGAQGEALLQEAQQLEKVLEELRAQNDFNRQLVEIELSFASFLLNLTAQEQNLNNIYGATGEVSSAPVEHRFLDDEV